MTMYYVDTSALGRRYLLEVGAAWVRTWIIPSTSNIIVISELTTIEMMATFARLQRQGAVAAVDAPILYNNFLRHVENEYLTVLLERSIIATARALVLRYKLRTLDAIQLACAIDVRLTLGVGLTFVSGDNNLLTAADAEGFTTDNPYLHA